MGWWGERISVWSKAVLSGSLFARPGSGSMRRIQNIAHLLSGNVAATLLGLATMGLVARGLGPRDFGVLALAISFTRAIERLVSFQSWQPIIRFGAHLDGDDGKGELKQLLKFGFLLDVGGALVGCLLALAIIALGGHLMHLSDTDRVLVSGFALTLLFSLAGMPTAVMRIFGRFRLAAYGQVSGAALRLLASAGAYAMGAHLTGFFIVWGVTQALSSLTTTVLAFHVLRRHGVTGLFRTRLRGITRRFPDLWRFTWSANFSLTIAASAQQLDTLIVGALAGPTAAGLYHIAQRVGRLAQQMGAQVQAVVYPELTRLWSTGAIRPFRRAVKEVEILVALGGVAATIGIALTAGWLVRVTAGPAFVAAVPLLIVQMIATTLSMNGTVTRSALLAMGCQRQVLRIVLLSTLLFHVTAFSIVPFMGAMGANVAHVVRGGAWLVGLALVYRYRMRRLPGEAAPAPSPRAEAVGPLPTVSL